MLKSVVRLALLSLINHFIQSKVARDNIAMHCKYCDTYNVEISFDLLQYPCGYWVSQ